MTLPIFLVEDGLVTDAQVRRWHEKRMAWKSLAVAAAYGWSADISDDDVLRELPTLTGGRLVKHARYYWLLLAEGHLTRQRFGSMLRTISALPLPDG